MKRRAGIANAVMLAVIASVARAAGPPSRAEGRKILVELNREWGKARVAFDRAAFERTLAPDFYVQLKDQRLTRKEFVDEISSPSPRARLTRFDVEVLTVRGDVQARTEQVVARATRRAPR